MLEDRSCSHHLQHISSDRQVRECRGSTDLDYPNVSTVSDNGDGRLLTTLSADVSLEVEAERCHRFGVVCRQPFAKRGDHCIEVLSRADGSQGHVFANLRGWELAESRDRRLAIHLWNAATSMFRSPPTLSVYASSTG